MESKLQELTQKIYQDGIEKANGEAKALLDNAKKEAEQILADAKMDSKEDVIKEYDKAALLTAISCAKDPDEVRKYLDREVYREILDFDFNN